METKVFLAFEIAVTRSLVLHCSSKELNLERKFNVNKAQISRNEASSMLKSVLHNIFAHRKLLLQPLPRFFSGFQITQI